MKRPEQMVALIRVAPTVSPAAEERDRGHSATADYFSPPGLAILLTFALWFVSPWWAPSQPIAAPAIEWQRLYGGTENDFLAALQETGDGGFILGGTSLSPAGGNKFATNCFAEDYWIVRLDAQGEWLWDRTFSGWGTDFLSSVQETSDAGYILGGTSPMASTSPPFVRCGKTMTNWGGSDYLVVRTDRKGNSVWETNLGGSRSETLAGVLQTADGGFLAAGISDSPPSGNKTTMPFTNLFRSPYPDYWIVRLSSQGDKLWEGNYGGEWGETLWTAAETRHGGFVLGGNSSSFPSGNKTAPNYGPTNWLGWTADFWLVRLDAEGNKLWDRSYGGTNDDTMYAIAELPDGGFALGGRSASPPGGNKTSPNYGGFDYWLVRTDAEGNKLWEQTFGGPDNDYLYSVAVTADGGLILGGYSHSPISGNKTAPDRGRSDYWIIRLDAEGNKLWEETYGGSRSDVIQRKCVQQTRDGGFILGGYSYSPVDGNKTEHPWFLQWCDFWIIKLAPEQPQLRIRRQRSSGGGVELALHGIKNLTYAIDSSNDLKNWTALQTNRLASSRPLELVDPSVTNSMQRFYRARRLP